MCIRRWNWSKLQTQQFCLLSAGLTFLALLFLSCVFTKLQRTLVQIVTEKNSVTQIFFAKQESEKQWCRHGLVRGRRQPCRHWSWDAENFDLVQNGKGTPRRPTIWAKGSVVSFLTGSRAKPSRLKTKTILVLSIKRDHVSRYRLHVLVLQYFYRFSFSFH